MSRFVILLIVLSGFISTSCTDGNDFNLFSIDKDKELGAQISAYLESEQSGLLVLDSSENPSAYAHLYRIRNYILNSNKLKHKDDFTWRARIIKNDSVLNAFATPGGYIYVFTGLIHYLDDEDQLAGVLAHEMAHADQRHSTAMLTKIYGFDFLLSLLFGTDNSTVKDVSNRLVGLSFSRKAEEDADKLSVNYLCRTKGIYKPDGAASFFEKLQKEKGKGQPVEFLSTHPSPPNRVEKLKKLANSSQCEIIGHSSIEFNAFKKTLLP